MEQSISGSSDKYRNFFEKSTDAMLIIENGLFVDCNRATIKMLHYDNKEEFLGTHPHELSPEYQPDGMKSSDKAEKMIALAFKNGDHCFEWMHMRKNGEAFPVEVSLTALIENGSKTLHTVWRDISSRKEAESELIRMQKLKGIVALAGGIAHDFNNMLVGVYGNISLVRDELEEGHPAFPFIVGAEKSINRAVSLSNQLLTFAKGGDPVKHPSNVGKLVRDVTHFSLSGSNVSPLIKEVSGLWSANIDKRQVEQVISNMVINAMHSMPDGGNLFIIMSNADLSLESCSGIKRGRYVKIIIRDEGIGIEHNALDHIFEPYFTTKKVGTGLGLATSHSIIDKHGGYIRVTSELGEGTEFTVYLPACTDDSVLEDKTDSFVDERVCSNAKIMIVDDEDYVRHITELILTKRGYSVESATDGTVAIEMYKDAMKAGAPFDLLLLDITIPEGMGGAETLHELLNIDPDVKAIVFSGYSDNPIMSLYEQYGFSGRLTKPFRTKELVAEIERVLS